MVFEIFGAFLNGLPLHIIRKENLLDFKYFENYIKTNEISIITISVSLFNKVVEYNPKIFRRCQGSNNRGRRTPAKSC